MNCRVIQEALLQKQVHNLFRYLEPLLRRVVSHRRTQLSDPHFVHQAEEQAS